MRYVSSNGGIRWENDWVNVSTVCAGNYVGLEEIDDEVWNDGFGPIELRRFLEHHVAFFEKFSLSLQRAFLSSAAVGGEAA